MITAIPNATVPTDAIYNDIYDVDYELAQYDMDDGPWMVPYDTLQAIAFNTLGRVAYYDSADPVRDIVGQDSGYKVCYIKRKSVLSWCMANFFGEPIITDKDSVSEKWKKTVRGFTISADGDDSEYIYFVHGIGYDWVDADLLGGNGDGIRRKKFEDGIVLIALYPERDKD